MISPILFAGIIFSAICSLVIPIGVWIYLIKKDKTGSMNRFILLGLFSCFVAQIIIRDPLLLILSTQDRFADFANNNPILFALFLSFTRGLFDTSARFLVLKFAVKENIRFNSALGTGFGHGLSETIAYTGISVIVNLIVSIMINTNSLPNTEQYKTIAETLSSQPISSFFAAGTERILAILIHIGLSVIIAYFIKKNMSAAGFAICLAAHTVYDLTVSLISQSGASVWLTVLVATVFAAAFTAVTIHMRNAENADTPKIIN